MTTTRFPRTRTRLFLFGRRWQRCEARAHLRAAWQGVKISAALCGALAGFYALCLFGALGR